MAAITVIDIRSNSVSIASVLSSCSYVAVDGGREEDSGGHSKAFL